MLTTQRKIAEQIKRRLKKFTDESDVDERELMLSVHQSLASIVRNRYFAGKQDESAEVDGSLFYTIHNNEILVDDNTDEFYIKTPSSAIALPFGVDIRRVWSKGGKGYVEVPAGFQDLHYGLNSSMLGGNIGFRREGVNLFFVNMDNSNKPDKLSVTLLLPFGSLDEDDEMSLPVDMIDEVVEIVFMKYGKTEQLPTDETNDSNDN